MHTHKSLFFLLAVVIVLAAGYFYFIDNNKGRTADNEPEKVPAAVKSYTSDKYKIAFEYPTGYMLTERDVEDGPENEHVIRILEDDQTSRDLLSGKLVGEIPASVLVTIVANPENLSIDDWMLANVAPAANAANLAKPPVKTDFKGRTVYEYRTTGLYEADSVYVAHNGNIIVITGEWATEAQPIRIAYRRVLDSFRFLD